jgi:hypothetical protein
MSTTTLNRSLRQTFTAITEDLREIGSLYGDLARVEIREKSSSMLRVVLCLSLGVLLFAAALVEFSRAIAIAVVTYAGASGWSLSDRQLIIAAISGLLCLSFSVACFLVSYQSSKSINKSIKRRSEDDFDPAFRRIIRDKKSEQGVAL